MRYPLSVRPPILAALLVAAAAAPAAAQPRAPEAGVDVAADDDAATLRARGREAVAEGRYEDAFVYFRAATARLDDGGGGAGAWLELAEVAERLRLDAIALEAYERYLADASEDAEGRAMIEGRLRVLRRLAEGATYVPREDGRAVNLLVDWEGRPLSSAGRPVRRLVDWQGRPVLVRRGGQLLSFSGWDGDPPAAEGGLGRRLDRP